MATSCPGEAEMKPWPSAVVTLLLWVSATPAEAAEIKV
jgi:hypothetical protein